MVRHPVVARIVQAYEKYDDQQAQTKAKRKQEEREKAEAIATAQIIANNKPS